MDELDEITKILNHPDPAERSMAFKLNSLSPYHILQVFHRGSQFPDDTKIQAIQHPFVDKWLLNSICYSADPNDLYLIMDHAALNPYHLRVIWEDVFKQGKVNYPLMAKLAEHKDLPDDIQLELLNYGDEAIVHLLKNPSVTPYILDNIAGRPGAFSRRVLQLAYQHPVMPQKRLEAALRWYRNDIELAEAAASNPAIPNSLIKDVLTNASVPRSGADPELDRLRNAISRNPNLTTNHLSSYLIKFESDLTDFIKKNS